MTTPTAQHTPAPAVSDAELKRISDEELRWIIDEQRPENGGVG